MPSIASFTIVPNLINDHKTKTAYWYRKVEIDTQYKNISVEEIRPQNMPRY